MHVLYSIIWSANFKTRAAATFRRGADVRGRRVSDGKNRTAIYIYTSIRVLRGRLCLELKTGGFFFFLFF